MQRYKTIFFDLDGTLIFSEPDVWELYQHFSFVITSTDAVNPKPDRAMFELALVRGGCDSAEAMHGGDNFYAAVGGARAAGIAPVLVDPKGLFPAADCLVIRSVSQLLDHLW